MEPILQQVQLTFRYSVHFTAGVFDAANSILRDVIAQNAAGNADSGPARTVFVLDSGVQKAWPGLAAAIGAYCNRNADVIRLSAPVVVISGGEEAKNHGEHLEEILTAINQGGICRHSYVVVIGGGAVIDVAGYAAAIAHRGVRLIRIPTTVLAQDDAGLGVKNGVNYFGKKNYLGTFATPVAVINDVSFLATLADRDWVGGITEAIKIALIKDAAFYDRIERDAVLLKNRDLNAMQALVRRSAEMHLAHIATSGDPFELGTSRPLDFGHWAGHKLEQLTHHRLRHGEAVGVGIALDSTYAYYAGLLPEKDWRRIMSLLDALGLPLYVPEMDAYLEDATHPKCLLRGLSEFREHLGGKLTISLIQAIGQGVDVHEIDTALMVKAIGYLRNLAVGAPPIQLEPALNSRIHAVR